MRTTLALLFTLAVGSAALRADDDKKVAPPKTGDKKTAAGKVDRTKLFDRLDANGDGKLTKEEFKATLDTAKAKVQAKGKGDKAAGKAGNLADATFDKMDADKNGSVSREEFIKFDPSAKAKGKGKDK